MNIHSNTFEKLNYACISTFHVPTLAHSDISKARQEKHKGKDLGEAKLKEFSFCMTAAGNSKAFW